MNLAPAPLFRDPIYDGAADPTIIWNHQEKAWWLLYTNRRANVPGQGFAWVHGTDIGIAASTDNGRTWLYRGVLTGLEFEPGRNTFWAPEVVWHAGFYHMYLSYVPGVPHDWSGPRHILHLTSQNLWNWHFEACLNLSSQRVIDACMFQLPTGTWRMWYKDEANQSHTYAADSADLFSWSVVGPIITDCAHEGPNVFFWQNYYWLITDPWSGLGVYRSSDAATWTRQANILAQPGQRPDDGVKGGHADVLVNGDNAYIFYFTHPDRKAAETYTFEEVHPYSDKRTSLQVARLEFSEGVLTCDRDKPFDFTLQPLP
jgi:hypothetical protein